MSQTGTPTEFLQLGITEPDDTLNVLVDLNGQWQKIDTGVKNVDTKANTNANGITALNTAVQDNTENITNILETNVNQQNSIDTLQSKVATLEQDDTSYGSRITAVEAGVQENSELINDLEVDLSDVKTDMGTVPSGSTLQGQVDGLDTRVTTLETEVGTVPAGETVQGQITTLNGQVNSGNIPFRFSVDGGGNYGYLKADDSFVPFSRQPDSIDGHQVTRIPNSAIATSVFKLGSLFVYTTDNQSSEYYRKAFYIPTKELVDTSSIYSSNFLVCGEFLFVNNSYYYYNRNTHSFVQIVSPYAVCSGRDSITYYTKETNQYTLHYIDLVDSTNNLTLPITLPSDKLQSNVTGRQGMSFSFFDPNNESYGLLTYLTDTQLITVRYENNNFTFNAYYNYRYSQNCVYSILDDNRHDIQLKFDNTNGIVLDKDGVYNNQYYKYIKVGNYAISTEPN